MVLLYPLYCIYRQLFEKQNKELLEQLKQPVLSPQPTQPQNDLEAKYKIDKRKLLKKCKKQEATIKSQTKEIESLKSKVHQKSKLVKHYERDIKAFQSKIQTVKLKISIITYSM